MKSTCRYIQYFVLLFALPAHTAFAGAIAGGEITYICLGSNKYQINLHVYGDCTAGTVSNNPITVVPLNCSTASFTKSLTQISVTDITPVCSTLNSYCSGSTSNPRGIRDYFFRDTIDLSSYSSCCMFTLRYESGSSRLPNLKCYANGDFVIEALLNKCISPCNNSPVLLNKPPMFVCAGQDVCFNTGFIDTADGDSLSIELVEPLVNSSTSPPPIYTCVPTFLGSPNMNGALPAGFHVDALTGDVCFRPTVVSTAPISLKVTEWRKVNGVMTIIGDTRRDMAIYVESCPANKVPNLQGPFVYDACAKSTICFSMQSSDADAFDTVRLSWDVAIPNASFTTSFGTGSAAIKEKGTFCWTPDNSDASSRPYVFTVTARDNGCPVTHSVTKAYYIYVNPIPSATRKLTPLKCGRALLKIIPDSNYGPLNYKWVIRKNGIIVTSSTGSPDSLNQQFAGPGKYVVQSTIRTLKNCSADYFDTLVIDTFLVADIPADTTICNNSSIYIPSTVYTGAAPYRYLWSSGNNDTLPDLNIVVKSGSKYLLTVTDSFGCVAKDSITVNTRVPYVNAGNDNAVCVFAGTQTLSGTPSGGNWSGTAVTGSAFDPLAAGTGVHALFYSFTDSSGCSNTDTMNMTVYSAGSVSAGNDTSVCQDNQLTLVGFPANGSWNGTGVTNNIFNPTSAGTGKHLLTYTIAASGCYATDSMFVTVNPLPVVSAGPDLFACANSTAVTLPGSPAGGRWSGTGVAGGKFDPIVAGPGIHNLFYNFTDLNGCSNSDSIDFDVKPLPAVFAGNDRIVCLGSGSLSLTGTPSGGTWTGLGISGNSFDPAITGKGVFQAIYTYIHSSGCMNSDSLIFSVYGPVADFSASVLNGFKPLTVNFADMSTGVIKWEWDFGDPASGSLNISTLQNPSHVYNQTGNYSVKLKVTDSTGCTDSLLKSNYIQAVNTGVIQFSGSGVLKVFPNPASKVFEVTLNESNAGNFSIQMFDINGRKVKEMEIINNFGVKINCEDLPPGIYQLLISGGNGESYRSRIVLQ